MFTYLSNPSKNFISLFPFSFHTCSIGPLHNLRHNNLMGFLHLMIMMMSKGRHFLYSPNPDTRLDTIFPTLDPHLVLSIKLNMFKPSQMVLPHFLFYWKDRTTCRCSSQLYHLEVFIRPNPAHDGPKSNLKNQAWTSIFVWQARLGILLKAPLRPIYFLLC